MRLLKATRTSPLLYMVTSRSSINSKHMHTRRLYKHYKTSTHILLILLHRGNNEGTIQLFGKLANDNMRTIPPTDTRWPYVQFEVGGTTLLLSISYRNVLTCKWPGTDPCLEQWRKGLGTISKSENDVKFRLHWNASKTGETNQIMHGFAPGHTGR